VDSGHLGEVSVVHEGAFVEFGASAFNEIEGYPF
jgi:hypothetical protein